MKSDGCLYMKVSNKNIYFISDPKFGFFYHTILPSLVKLLAMLACAFNHLNYVFYIYHRTAAKMLISTIIIIIYIDPIFVAWQHRFSGYTVYILTNFYMFYHSMLCSQQSMSYVYISILIR